MSRPPLLPLAGACLILMAGCKSVSAHRAAAADQHNAANLMIQYGCPTCHVIPDVPGAVGKVGPSLYALAQRSYLAGALPNTPQNLQQWVMHPQHFRPGTAMPEMGVTQQSSQTIAEFLESRP
jgi:cytochrome c